MDNLEEFRAAINQAQLSQEQNFLEVTERLFNYLCKDPASKYLTYGNPGVRVFKKGERKEIEADELLSAEALYLKRSKEAESRKQ